ncbi:unnamed protein product, partial [Effrenium voratum]
DGMVDIKSPKCRCGRAKPYFGMPGDARATCCAKCKEDGMMDIKNRKCRCGRAKPYFGMPGDARATCCAKCKEDGMVDIKHGKCRCGRAIPLFGMPCDTRATCCAKCKEDGMVDIKSPKCRCGRARPYFGMPGDARATCCAKCKEDGMVCKEDGMVDIKSRKCRCGRAKPYFGMPGDARATCCVSCKEDEMVDIVQSRCLVCGKRAFFPDAAGKPRQLCAAHSAQVGAHVLSSSCFSRAASDCLDILEDEVGYKFPFRHRFDAAARAWSGKEFAGLIRNRAVRPDAYHPERREVVEFLGNYYHGFPVEHPQHGAYICVGSKPAPDVYRDTMERLDLFAAEGLRVFYIWEHEFVEWRKRAASGKAVPIASLLRRHQPKRASARE